MDIDQTSVQKWSTCSVEDFEKLFENEVSKNNNFCIKQAINFFPTSKDNSTYKRPEMSTMVPAGEASPTPQTGLAGEETTAVPAGEASPTPQTGPGGEETIVVPVGEASTTPPTAPAVEETTNTETTTTTSEITTTTTETTSTTTETTTFTTENSQTTSTPKSSITSLPLKLGKHYFYGLLL